MEYRTQKEEDIARARMLCKAIAGSLIVLLLIIGLWGSFTIIPAGHRGVVLWWGRVEDRIMGEGFNFKVPVVEKVIKMEVRVQPHSFKEISSASKEYQEVRMCGMMNFHIEAARVNHLYQTVGKDFAKKVIDPAFNDFVKEVTPLYPITEVLPKREEIRRLALQKLQENLKRYGIVIDDIYFSNIGFSPEYTKAIEDKQVAQQVVETQKQILEQKKVEAQQRIAEASGRSQSILLEAQGQAKANDILLKSLTSKLVEYKAIEKWDGQLPQITGGVTPFVNISPRGKNKDSD